MQQFMPKKKEAERAIAARESEALAAQVETELALAKDQEDPSTEEAEKLLGENTLDK